MNIRLNAGFVSGVTLLLLGLGAGEARAETVVQVPLTGVLDGRSVTTLTGGVLVPWTVPTDGGGLQNAFATMAVAMKQGAPPAYALPDDGKFPANARHPEVVLNYSNSADATAPQTHLVKAGEVVMFAMPAAVYSKVFLFFNGAAGGSTVTVTLTYADGTEMVMATVPDYYADISATDPVVFNLATNLAKYDKTSKVTETNHHNITGVELHPAAGKTLTRLSFTRAAMGNLVFWGATGVATSDVAGTGGTGGTGAGGAASGGAGGSAGSTGIAGATGNGGSAGLAGSGGGAPGATGGAESSSGAGGASAGAAPNAGAAPIPYIAPTDDGGCRLSSGRSTDARSRAWWAVLGAAGALCLARRRAR